MVSEHFKDILIRMDFILFFCTKIASSDFISLMIREAGLGCETHTLFPNPLKIHPGQDLTISGLWQTSFQSQLAYDVTLYQALISYGSFEGVHVAHE